jgi:hypothetical protein
MRELSNHLIKPRPVVGRTVEIEQGRNPRVGDIIRNRLTTQRIQKTRLRAFVITVGKTNRSLFQLGVGRHVLNVNGKQLGCRKTHLGTVVTLCQCTQSGCRTGGGSPLSRG